MVWAMKGSSDSPTATNADPTSPVKIESFLDQAEAMSAVMARQRALAPQFKNMQVVHELMMINSAELRFQASVGNGRYVDPAMLVMDPSNQGLEGIRILPPSFIAEARGGYRFEFIGSGKGETFFEEFNPGYSSYVYVAYPESDAVGPYTFALVSETARVHYRTDGRVPDGFDASVTDSVAAESAPRIAGVPPAPNETSKESWLRQLINRFLGSAVMGEAQLAYHEDRAIKDLRVFVSAQEAFLASVGLQGYGTPEVLSDPSIVGIRYREIPPFIEGYFTQDVREGYRFTFEGTSPVHNGDMTVYPDYTYTATPVGDGPANRRSFAVRPDGLIRFRKDGTPPQTSDTILGTEKVGAAFRRPVHSVRENHAVHDVDDAVGLEHVRLRDLRPGALLVLEHDVVALHRRPQHPAADGLQRRRALFLLDPLLQVRARDPAGHDVIGEHLRQRALVLGLQQRVDRSRRQFRERRVGRGEHGERARRSSACPRVRPPSPPRPAWCDPPSSPRSPRCSCSGTSPCRRRWDSLRRSQSLPPLPRSPAPYRTRLRVSCLLVLSVPPTTNHQPNQGLRVVSAIGLRPPSRCFGGTSNPARASGRNQTVREKDAIPVPRPPRWPRRELLKMLPLAGAAVLLHPSWRSRAIEHGLALSDAASEWMFDPARRAPTFSDAEVTPFDRFPLNSYLVHDPEIDLDAWRLEVSGLVSQGRAITRSTRFERCRA